MTGRSRHAAPVQQLDGASGSVLARTEPKVRASAVAATVSAVLLWLIHRYVPGAAVLPAPVEAGIGAVLTGCVSWAAGYLARAVDRLDLFPAGPPPELAALTGDVVDAILEEVMDRLAAAGVLTVPAQSPVPPAVRPAEPATEAIPLPAPALRPVPGPSNVVPMPRRPRPTRGAP